MSAQALAAGAVRILNTPSAEEKARAGRRLAADWRDSEERKIGLAQPPRRPARPEYPALRPPREVPRRKIGPAVEGRIALLHALAHIELNAIDLAWDIVARFSGSALPESFHDDWVHIADEESKHYLLLSERLKQLGSYYGALPAHDGLWQASEETAGDLLARLAVVPMVLEARGLDVTPDMIRKLEQAGDKDSAAVLEVIYQEEIGHVAVGRKWFEWLCAQQGKEPVGTWQELVSCHFRGPLKPPFNAEGRAQAGFPACYYEPLAGTT
ncbi:ferritin-like domain-containing protein [Fodinicurvata halophila]|uniref:Ferritin-like domain-containing protein n=1 Tax=Fodinicurvata halophila TaxID=1419723 RepID=A0ABV8UIY5_9PROT